MTKFKEVLLESTLDRLIKLLESDVFYTDFSVGFFSSDSGSIGDAGYFNGLLYFIIRLGFFLWSQLF